MKKQITDSITRTAEWLMRDYKVFDYGFFCIQVVVGLKRDVQSKVDAPVVDGEWLGAYDTTGRYYEINLYKQFKSL